MNRLGQCLRADGYAMTRRRTIWLLPLCLMALIIMDSVDVVPVMLHGYTIEGIWYFYFQSFSFGGLYGGIAALVSTRTTQPGVVVVSPLVFTFIVIRLCQLLTIYDQYRLDRWLVMRTMPPGLTIGQSILLITALCLALSALIGAACVLSGRRAMHDA